MESSRGGWGAGVGFGGGALRMGGGGLVVTSLS